MSQQLTLELSDEVYNALQHQADAIGLSVTDWIITKLGNSDIKINKTLIKILQKAKIGKFCFK